MTNDFESAFRQLLKTIVQEVAVDLLKDRQIPDRHHSPQTTLTDDVFLLNSREAAKRLAISEGHLSRLTRSGILPCVRVGQCVRYNVETIQKWIRNSESTEPPDAKSDSVIKSHVASATVSKARPKPSPKLTAKRGSAKKTDSVTGMKPKQEPDISIRRSSKKTDSEERQNPFFDLLDHLGVNRRNLPAFTNGELMRIAEVDIPTFHGWKYLNRELPEAAMNKLREHFCAYLKSDGLGE